MIDKFKVRVLANRLVMEAFDDDGKPIVVTKTDTFDESYQETLEVQYRRGDIIYLPMAEIEKRRNSLEMVLEPVKVGPVIQDPKIPESEELEPEEPEEASFKVPMTAEEKDKDEEPTVAQLIPKKDKSKDKSPGKSK